MLRRQTQLLSFHVVFLHHSTVDQSAMQVAGTAMLFTVHFYRAIQNSTVTVQLRHSSYARCGGLKDTQASRLPGKHPEHNVRSKFL
jgi:hypothetical protein